VTRTAAATRPPSDVRAFMCIPPVDDRFPTAEPLAPVLGAAFGLVTLL
jgi:hypothetical protein